MNIVVTGANGFVGAATVDALTAQGHVVWAVGRQPITKTRYKHTYIQWDITETPPESMPQSVDAIVHVAAKVDDWGDYDTFAKVNIAGSLAVSRHFRNYTKFIHISTASVYTPSPTPISENAAPRKNFLNNYSRTKYEAESALIDAKVTGLCILRPHAVYGPGDTTLLPRVLSSYRNGHLWGVGTGNNHISLTYIDNLITAIDVCLSTNNNAPQIYNVADKDAPSTRELFETVMQEFILAGTPFFVPSYIAGPLAAALEVGFKYFHVAQGPRLTRYAVDQLSSTYTLDTSHISSIGYTPTINYREGIARTAHVTGRYT